MEVLNKPKSNKPRLELASLCDQLNRSKSFFRFHYLDIGPSESFNDFANLKLLIESANKINYFPRLLTSGVHFENPEVLTTQFAELSILGIKAIYLKLNNETSAELKDGNIINFLTATSCFGISPEIHYEFINDCNKQLLRLARISESHLSYSVLYCFKRRKQVSLSELSKHPNIMKRIIILSDGAVVIRSYKRNDLYNDMKIGSILSTNLD